MNINQLCMNCMTGKLDERGVCANCNSQSSTTINDDRHLPVRSILRGKYLVGKVIGEGGFGITYIGYDLDLQIRVAIKEFCPREYVAREMTDRLTIFPYDKESGEFFEAEKEKFVQEARRLARFRNEEGVVSVLDYFKENGTAYIVMEFIEGVTLKKYLGMLNVRIEVNELLTLLKPVMTTLDKMHKDNIIHRDISPDNIMIRKDRKQVYLIDFGSARDVNGEHSMSVYKKGSYTPVEQQSRHGKQGPWTDVYSLCATIYYCITGRNIPEAVDRTMEDNLIAPSKLGVEISEVEEQALLNGLMVNPATRTQTVKELKQALYEDSLEEKKEPEVKMVAPVENRQGEIRENHREAEKEERVVTPVDNHVTEAELVQRKKTGAWIIGLGSLIAFLLVFVWYNDYYLNRTTVTTLEDGSTRENVYKDGEIVSQKDYYPNGDIKIHTYIENGNKYSTKYLRDEDEKNADIEKYVNDIITEAIFYFEGMTAYVEYIDGNVNNYKSVIKDKNGKITCRMDVEDEKVSSIQYDYPKEGWEAHLTEIKNEKYFKYYDASGNLVATSTVVNDVWGDYQVYDEMQWNSIDWDNTKVK